MNLPCRAANGASRSHVGRVMVSASRQAQTLPWVPPYPAYDPAHMPRLLVLPLTTLTLLLAAPAVPAADDMPFYRRAASCVAVLERDVVEMAGRYKAGERNVKPGLVRLTEQGFAFIGRAYLRGLRKPEADKLIDEAKAAQKAMAPEALVQLSTGCKAEGAKLYADASGLEQMIVSNRAKARVDKLLAPKKS